MKLCLPFPPSVNTLFPTSRQGRRFLSKRGKDYVTRVAHVVAGARALGECPGEALTGRVSVEIYVYPPDHRRRDIDNMCKAILDCLTKVGVWLDDEQIDRLCIRRMRVLGEGYAVVEVSQIS